MICYHCGKDNPVVGVVGRGDNCSQCGASLRVCRNCHHYDPRAYNECREPSADRVLDKEKANFCDYFAPGSAQQGPAKPALDPKAAAEALFRKKD